MTAWSLAPQIVKIEKMKKRSDSWYFKNVGKLVSYAKWLKHVVFALVFLVFFTRALFLLDSDFGWHIRMGEIIAKSGIPQVDPFSYTMPSYPVVSHEWLLDVVMTFLYSKLGDGGLALLFTAVAVGSVYISLKVVRSRNTYLNVGLFLLGAGVLLRFSGVRPQAFSWLMMSALIYVIYHRKLAKYLPAIFLLWSNIHGSFVAGIVALFVYTAARVWRERRIAKKEVLLLVASTGATFVNPYGWRAWWEVWMSVTDTGLRFTIQEWMPSVLTFDFPYIFLATLSAVLVVKYRRKLRLEEHAIYWGFLSQAILSVRHVPLWAIVALPLTAKGVSFLKKEAVVDEVSAERFQKVAKAFFGVLVAIFGLQVLLHFIFAHGFSEENYPENAVNYLRARAPEGEIFTVYNWGGYFTWKYPEKRVFIDGRMPSWRGHNVPGESDYAFRDYQDIIFGSVDPEEAFSQYGVDTVVLPTEGSAQSDIVALLADYIGGKLGLVPETQESFVSRLVGNGWGVVYEDEAAIIYQRD